LPVLFPADPADLRRLISGCFLSAFICAISGKKIIFTWVIYNMIMRKAFSFFLKSFLIVSCLISVSGQVAGQDKKQRAKIHQISLDYSQDFVLRQYVITTGTHYGPIYGYVLKGIRHNEFSYSLGVKYKYYKERFFYFKMGLFYRNQVINYGPREVHLNGLRTLSVGFNDTWLGYIDIPVGIGFSFFNKSIVRPYIEAGLNTSFIFHEKADCRFYNKPGSYEDVTLESNKLKSYTFKGSINAGCEFHIRRKYVLGIDVGWRTKPLLQNTNSVVYKLYYSNYSFGLSFGYVIK
jgi:hypothetical protein